MKNFVFAFSALSMCQSAFAARSITIPMSNPKIFYDGNSEALFIQCTFVNHSSFAQEVSVTSVNGARPNLSYYGAFNAPVSAPITFTLAAATSTVLAQYDIAWGVNVGNVGSPSAQPGVPSSVIVRIAQDRGAISADCQRYWQGSSVQSSGWPLAVNGGRPF